MQVKGLSGASKFLSKIGWRYPDKKTKEKMIELHVDSFLSILNDIDGKGKD